MKQEQKLRLELWQPEQLAENPLNWKKHPKIQQWALEELIHEVGWAGVALYNERTGRLIDGHLRRELASKYNMKIPVLIGNWTEEQELKLLMFFDQIGSLAYVDQHILNQLIEAVGEMQEGTVLEKLLNEMQNKAVDVEALLIDDLEKEEEFKCRKITLNIYDEELFKPIHQFFTKLGYKITEKTKYINIMNDEQKYPSTRGIYYE